MNANIVLALLEKLTDLTKEEAKAIAEKLSFGVQPARYDDAEQLIEEVVSGVKERQLSHDGK